MYTMHNCYEKAEMKCLFTDKTIDPCINKLLISNIKSFRQSSITDWFNSS